MVRLNEGGCYSLTFLFLKKIFSGYVNQSSPPCAQSSKVSEVLHQESSQKNLEFHPVLESVTENRVSSFKLTRF